MGTERGSTSNLEFGGAQMSTGRRTLSDAQKGTRCAGSGKGGCRVACLSADA